MPVSSATIIVSGILLIISIIVVYKWKYNSLFALIPLLGLIFYKYSSNIAIFMYFYQAILIGIIIGYNLKREKSTQFLLISAGLLFVVFFVLYYFYLQKQYGIELVEYYSPMIRKQITDVNTGLTKKQQEDSINFIISIIKMIIPFVFFLSGIIYTMIFYIPARFVYILAYLRRPMQSKGIEFFKINDNWVYLLIGCILTLLAISGNRAGFLFFMVLNVLLILLTIYFFQALGIIKFIMIKKKLPVYFMVILIIMLMFNSRLLIFIVMILAGIGVLDIWADFRKLNIQKEK